MSTGPQARAQGKTKPLADKIQTKIFYALGMDKPKLIDKTVSTMRTTGSFVDLGISYALIEGHADEDVSFVMINESLASSQKTVHDAFLFFQAKAKSKAYFKTPLYTSRKIRVKALKYDADNAVLRLKLQAEADPESPQD